MFVCAWAVQQGLVYRVCNEDGEWAQKNTSECEDDPAEVCVYSTGCSWWGLGVGFVSSDELWSNCYHVWSCLPWQMVGQHCDCDQLDTSTWHDLKWLSMWKFVHLFKYFSRSRSLFTSFVPDLINSACVGGWVCLKAKHGGYWLSLLLVLQQQYGRVLSQLRIMYTVGYSLSLGALLLALGILITFRYEE